MGIFDRLGNFFRNTSETKEAPTVMYDTVGSNYTRKDRYDDYAREGYQQNAIVV